MSRFAPTSFPSSGTRRARSVSGAHVPDAAARAGAGVGTRVDRNS